MVYLIIFVVQAFILYLLSRHLTRSVHSFLYRITKSKKWTTYLVAIIFLPGTFLHEIAHFLMALVLLVPVGQLELLPEIQEENTLKLGSVPVARTDVVRKTLIGVAPIILGVALIFGTLFWATSANMLQTPLVVFGIGYLIFEVGNTMFSSKKDLEGTWVLLVLIAVIYVVAYFIGIRISLDPSSPFMTKFIEVVKQANLFLLVPIAIDLAVILLLKLTRR